MILGSKYRSSGYGLWYNKTKAPDQNDLELGSLWQFVVTCWFWVEKVMSTGSSFQTSGTSCHLANEKSARRSKHCALAVVRQSQKFSPRHRPLLGMRVSQNLISWKWSLPLPTNPVWWGSRQAILSYCGNRPTNTAKNQQTDRTDYNTLCHS